MALSKLHPEVDSNNAQHLPTHALPEEGEDSDMAESQKVGFAQRAFPLLEMLRAAKSGGHDIVWGV
ncbi:DUF1840 family protein [Pseudoduganella sp. UC29_106]|uniref:DUF1840 family protein n=1 Tax=Pseudoduganella sp. UC29_106 TaxID=3374553 RepID=UPI003757D795